MHYTNTCMCFPLCSTLRKGVYLMPILVELTNLLAQIGVIANSIDVWRRHEKNTKRGLIGFGFLEEELMGLIVKLRKRA